MRPNSDYSGQRDQMLLTDNRPRANRRIDFQRVDQVRNWPDNFGLTRHRAYQRPAYQIGFLQVSTPRAEIDAKS